MEHREYIRIVPGAKNAVLFIHGIIGTPNHFVTQIPLVDLVPQEWSVYSVLLDGHGGSVDDLAASSMNRWKSQVFGVFRSLCETHDRVIPVAHSMGTLFAMQMALDRPEKVPFLFLIAAPMRPGVRPSCMVNCLRLVFGRIREDHPLEAATRSAAGVQTTRKLWKYIKWIPRFLELFREISETERRMRELRVPCIAWQSRRDELVTNRSTRVLKRSGVMEVRELSSSTHFFYDPEERDMIQTAFTSRCDAVKTQD